MNNNQKATKRALLTSVMALVMCVVMLVGTTFAWFTDTASTGVNKIQAGNLDVALEMRNGEKWDNAENQTLNFMQKQSDGSVKQEANILWEPGAKFQLPTLRVANNGNLALKYKVVFSAVNGGNDPMKLAKVLDVYLNDQPVGTLYDALTSTDPDGFAHGNLTAKGTDGATSGELSITVKMQESAGNEYKNLSIGGVAVTVYATQLNSEFDSFGPDYDKNAEYPIDTWNGDIGDLASATDEDSKTVTIDSGKLLAALAKSVNGGKDYNGYTIKLTKNLDLNGNEWTPIGKRIKDAAGNTTVIPFKGTFDGGNFSVTNMKITDYNGYAAFFGAVDGAIIKNLTVSGEVSGQDVAGIVANITGGATIQNCVNKAAINGEKKAAGIAVMNKGDNTTTIIENCKNFGAISSKNDRAAGIINLIQATGTTIKNCVNNGTVDSTGPATFGAGGIVSWAAADNFVITDCKNTATVTAKGAAGGILGGTGNVGTVSNCTNGGAVVLSGTAGARNEHANIGGIVGQGANAQDKLTATKNTNNGALTGNYTRRTIAEDVTLADTSYSQLYIAKGTEVNITAGNLENMITNYGTLTIETQIGASGATGINTQFHNYGKAILNCTMSAGSIHSHVGATTIFNGGSYHFTCVENMRNGMNFVAGEFNDLRKANGQTQWTDDEFNACVAAGSTATKSGHVWTVTAQ